MSIEIWVLVAVMVAGFAGILLKLRAGGGDAGAQGNMAELEREVALRDQKVEAQEQRLKDLQEERNEAREALSEAREKIIHLATDKAKVTRTLEEKSVQLQEQKELRQDLETRQQQLVERNGALEADLREKDTSLRAEAEKLAELKAQFELQKAELKKEFQVVSEKILQDRQRALSDQNKEGVSALLKPLQDQLQGFQKRVNEVHTEAVKGNASLGAEIKKVLDIGLKMSGEANNLTQALKGDSQQRGAWGEAQLERTLQMSGLEAGTHYEGQSAFRDSEGNLKRTDYLVNLPDGKHLIIDSKVSLVAYDAVVSAETEEDHAKAMVRHLNAVRSHVKDLAGKDYTNLIGVRSPSFVLMFMPLEAAYIEALKQDANLFSAAYNRGVILVSHTTLIPILRTVANLWMLDKSNKEAREIGGRAGDIYDSVCRVAERFDKLGNTLNAASNQYNDAVKAISGKQGLVGKVERFTKLSNKISKKMPEIEERHIEFRTSDLKVEALPEPEPEVTNADLQVETVEAPEA